MWAGAAPTRFRTESAVTLSVLEAMAWSRMERASRMEPSPASGKNARGSSSASIFFPGQEIAKLVDDVVKFDGAKAEVLATRANGLGNVFGLGCSQHEDDVIGRFLQ